MTFDPKSLMAEHGLSNAMESAIAAAYQRGIKDGIQRIVAAAQGIDGPPEALPAPAAAASVRPVPEMAEPPEVDEVETGEDGIKRVRRGLVQETIGKLMRELPGFTISDYEKYVAEIEPDISSKSVGNEIRRGEGTKYKRDREGGNRWFPFDYGNDGDGSALPAAPPPSSLFNQKGGEGDGPATT